MPAARLPERFEDGGLLLRRWVVGDAPMLHAIVTASIDHLRPWMPWISYEPLAVEQRAELIATWEQEWEDGGAVFLAVIQDGVAVGSTGLHRRIGPDGLEIGYWICRDHAGRGLATRVAGLLTTGAFTVPGITHVEIHCDEANAASARVPEKLGFPRVGDISWDPEAPAETGRRRVYRMDRRSWIVE